MTAARTSCDTREMSASKREKCVGQEWGANLKEVQNAQWKENWRRTNDGELRKLLQGEKGSEPGGSVQGEKTIRRGKGKGAREGSIAFQ